MTMKSVKTGESDREIYEREFKGWLPSQILDSHVHVYSGEEFPADYEAPKRACIRKFGGCFRMEQCEEWAKAWLPGHEYGTLSFGSPQPNADRDRAATYTGEVSDNKRHFGMTLVSPSDSVEVLRGRIIENKLVGYKPYLNFVDWKDKNDVEVLDMLTPEQLELANELGLAIVFHIPRSGRLADPLNQKQMVELCKRYPNANIIWAHIGRAYWMDNVIGQLDGIAEYPNSYIDTAMVNHPQVLEYAFSSFPRERILFGSDAPIAWLLGKSVEINNQYAYLMGEDYEIGTAIYDSNHVVTFTSFFYEQLRGIRKAVEKAGLTRDELERFFYGNAHELLSGVAERVAKV